MNLTLLSPLGFLLGLGAIAAGLYVLQRLRVRHEERVVVTTLFWREATEESRARSLIERFRHPLAYLMALLVAGLLWLGAGHPDSVRASGTRHVLLLDASAGMAAGDRFESALEALEEELAQSPRDRTEVLWCGARVRTLLAPGEDRALLRARLEGLTPEAAPASVERAIAAHLACREGSDDTSTRRFVVVGDAPVRAGLTTALGEDDVLERVELEGAPAVGRGITALGVAPAASGRWSNVDVLIDVRGPGAGDVALEVSLDASNGGPALTSGGTRRTLSADHVQHLIADVPAAGALLRVALATGDDVVADDVATVRLPDRPRIRVVIDGSLSGAPVAAIRAALSVDAAVEFVADSSEADVIVSAGTGGDLPTLALVPAAEQEEAILLGHGDEIDSRAALLAAIGELGLDRIDASSLADALDRPIAVGAAPAATRQLSLWLELFDAERTTFVESRAFPLLVGRAVRWLADVEPVVPYRAAGRAVPRRVGEPQRATLVVALADVVGSSLLAPSTTTPQTVARATLVPSAPEGPGGWRPYTWFLLFALFALGAEWALFQRGRMP